MTAGTKVLDSFSPFWYEFCELREQLFEDF